MGGGAIVKGSAVGECRRMRRRGHRRRGKCRRWRRGRCRRWRTEGGGVGVEGGDDTGGGSAEVRGGKHTGVGGGAGV